MEYLYYTNEPKLKIQASKRIKMFYVSITFLEIAIFVIYYFGLNTGEWHNIWYTWKELESFGAKFDNWGYYYSLILHFFAATHLMF